MKQQQLQSVVNERVRVRFASARAFTLVELMVAIGVLVLMLTMAGSVFSLTLKSTGQAKALTDVSDRLRTFERMLSEDLRGVRRQAGKMIVVPHEVYAYWTEDQQSIDPNDHPVYARFPGGGDPERMWWDPEEADTTRRLKPEMPRADMLVLFTARRGASLHDPSIDSNLQMVTYGHAELGELETTASSPYWRWRTPPTDFAPYYMNATPAPWTAPSPREYPLPASQWHLARRATVIVNRWPPEADSSLAAFCANRPNDAGLFDGTKDILGMDLIGLGDEAFNYVTEVASGDQAPTENWSQRSRLDLTPPAALAERLGPYMLPHCASFKVEWTCSPRGPARDALALVPETLWFDRMVDTRETIVERLGKLRATLLASVYAGEANGMSSFQNIFQFDPRFTSTDLAEPMIWHAENPNTEAEPNTPDPLFPTALRITVDVFDDAGRLERPIRHVMIIPVGT